MDGSAVPNSFSQQHVAFFCHTGTEASTAQREKAVVRPLATGCSVKAPRCDWGTCRSSVQNGDDGDGLAVQVFMLCLAAFAFWSVALWHAEDRRSIHRSPTRRQTLQVNAPLILMGRAGMKHTPHAIMKFKSIWI